MEGRESVLEAIYEDEEAGGGGGGGEEETLDEDVDMVDAETRDGHAELLSVDGDGGGEAAQSGSRGRNQKRRGSKKRNKNKRKRKGSAAPNITDINRFVIDTCRRLKEKKSYLVWNAVGCLGVSAVSELVKEVDTIQGCGGQRTADGKRHRTGGGILWNILKSREPNAYKEIMAKGREFEKQLWQPQKKQLKGSNQAVVSQGRNVPDEAVGGEVLNSSDHMPEIQQGLKQANSDTQRISVRDRIRMPVSYDDLFEEGEIHELSDEPCLVSGKEDPARYLGEDSSDL